ncbi:MAG: hypothetical protein WC554_05595 [Clostridia bacterium]
MDDKILDNNSENPVEGVPVCEKCGNVMIKEDQEWVCPHCQGEIDFLGDDDE